MLGFKSARLAAGLSAKQVADAMGVTRIAVYFWEDGTCAPAVKRLPELAKLYGCTVDELLAGAEAEK